MSCRPPQPSAAASPMMLSIWTSRDDILREASPSAARIARQTLGKKGANRAVDSAQICFPNFSPSPDARRRRDCCALLRHEDPVRSFRGCIPVRCSPCTQSWVRARKSALGKLFAGPLPDSGSWGLKEPHAPRPAHREEAIVHARHSRAPPPSHTVAAFSSLLHDGEIHQNPCATLHTKSS